MRNRSSGVLEVTSTIESFGPNVGLDLPLFDHNLIGWGACAGADVGNDADEDEDEDEGSLSGNMIIVRNATTGKDSPMQSSLAKKTRMLLYCWKRKLRTSSSFLFFSFLFFSFLFFSNFRRPGRQNMSQGWSTTTAQKMETIAVAMAAAAKTSGVPQ